MNMTFKTLGILSMGLAMSFGAAANAAKKAVPYQPIKKISSNGKAFTECASGERRKSLKGRKICVNKAGEYYFLAD